jgi:hypothetical protein
MAWIIDPPIQQSYNCRGVVGKGRGYSKLKNRLATSIWQTQMCRPRVWVKPRIGWFGWIAPTSKKQSTMSNTSAVDCAVGGLMPTACRLPRQVSVY